MNKFILEGYVHHCNLALKLDYYIVYLSFDMFNGIRPDLISS